MKVLSIINPWAHFIMYHGKNIENRTWKTDYRGRILIHVSKKVMPDYKGLIRNLLDTGYIDKQNYHWKLRDPIPFEKPVPARGSLGLWEYSGEIG